MRSSALLFPCLLAVITYLVKDVEAKLDPHIWCGACIALMEDMKIQISSTDQSKKLQTGSFRILPDGSQELKEIPYATSDLFLTEELERICNAMHHYVETVDGKTGKKIVIRKSSYDGSSISMKNVQTSPQLTKSLVYACETIIEDHEEDIIKMLKTYNRKESAVEKELCVEVAGLCTENDVDARMWALANAIMAGFQVTKRTKKEFLKNTTAVSCVFHNTGKEESLDFTLDSKDGKEFPEDTMIKTAWICQMEYLIIAEKADESLRESEAQEALDRELEAELEAETGTSSPESSDQEEDGGEDITEQLVKEGSADIPDTKDEL